MKEKNKKETRGGVKTDSSCILWTGPEITCLDICQGDYLNDVVFAIATKVCESSTSSDLSTLSLQCLVDKLQAIIPTEKNILTILQLIIDNECKLKDLIDIVNGRITGDPLNTNLNLNLGCLATTDGFGNAIQLTQLELDQLLINTVCSIRTRTTTLEGQVLALQATDTDLQTQINSITSDPSITTCISSIRPTSQSVVDLANNYCTYKSAVGTLAEIQFVLASQGADLNTEFSAEPGWNVTPTSEAQSLSNLWIAFNNYFNRLKVIEQTCCAPSCDKIKIGAIPTFDFTAHTLSLEFTAGAGTVIPAGFTDAGTQITITDKNGVKAGPYSTSTTPIALNSIISGLYVGSLATGDITISFKTNFVLKDSNNVIILTCKDCYSIIVPYSSGCCVYTNSGSVNNTIIYKTTIA